MARIEGCVDGRRFEDLVFQRAFSLELRCVRLRRAANESRGEVFAGVVDMPWGYCSKWAAWTARVRRSVLWGSSLIYGCAGRQL